MVLSEESTDEVVEIFDMENYNAFESKMIASLDWLVEKAFDKLVPPELVKPYYFDEQNVLHPKPSVIYALTSAELYTNCLAKIFNDPSFLSQNHTGVLHSLKRNGVQVLDQNGALVTESMLTQTAPLKINAHLAVIDGLMNVFVRETASVHQISLILQKYPADENDQIPMDSEEALLGWINKISRMEKPLNTSQVCTSLDDLSNGIAILKLLVFYYPELINSEDICVSDPISIADSLHNLRLIKQFCLKHISAPLYHFPHFEDLLYTHHSLKANIVAFLTDLFVWLEKQDVKSPISSCAKRHFGHVNIPDLRPFGRNDKNARSTEVNRFTLKPSKKINNRPKDMSTSTLSSVGSSIVTSLDSLNTSHSMDSLQYHRTAHTIRNSPNTAVTCTTFAEITPIRRLSNGEEMQQENDQKPISRNLIKMQLGEKRRQIEALKMTIGGQRAEKNEALSKEAFLKLYKKPMLKDSENLKTDDTTSEFFRPSSAQSQTDKSETETIVVDSVAISTNTPSKISSIRHRDDDRSIVIDEISVALRDIKQQMSRLASEQQAIQKKLALSPSREIALNPEETSSLNYTSSWVMSNTNNNNNNSDSHYMLVDQNNSSTTITTTKTDQSWSSAMAKNYNNGIKTMASSTVAPSSDDLSLEIVTGRLSSSGNNVGFVVVGSETLESQSSKGKDIFVASAEQRKAKVAKKYDSMKDECQRLQEERLHKEEMMRRRKEERDSKRSQIYEQYQRKKLEQQLKNNTVTMAAGDVSSRKLDSTFAIPRLPPKGAKTDQPPPHEPVVLNETFDVQQKSARTKSSRPLSQILTQPVPLSSTDRSKTVSIDNIDQADSTLVTNSTFPNEPTCKVFVKPTQKSNRGLVLNALEHCVLQGELNKNHRQKCLTEIAKSISKHFMVLFRDSRCQFRAIYSWDQSTDSLRKLYGIGPTVCHEGQLSALFKFDCGAKRFLEIPARHFSATTDGFTIRDECWQRGVTVGQKSAATKT